MNYNNFASITCPNLNKRAQKQAERWSVTEKNEIDRKRKTERDDDEGEIPY